MKTKITEEEFKVLLVNGVKDFSQYRMEVERLVCSWNNLTALPELPNVEVLYCENNQLTALPDLTSCLQLVCHKNQLTKLPYMPVIEYYYGIGNNFKK